MTAITADYTERLSPRDVMREMYSMARDFFAGRGNESTAEHINGPAHSHFPKPMEAEAFIPAYGSATTAADEKADKQYRGWLDMRKLQHTIEKISTELRHLMRIGVIGKKPYAAALHHPRAPRRPEDEELYAHGKEEQILQHRP